MIIEGNIVDIFNRSVSPGRITISNNVIIKIEKSELNYSNYILPGLIDSHVHIESSMLIPSRFAELVVPRGTVGVVSDPHEIANVLGVKGVEYMMNDAEKVPLKCFFGVPSCVPATDFESSGSRIESDDVEYLLRKGAPFLAEMMNFPGVIYQDKEVWKKLKLAQQYNVPIDGHAPGVKGDELVKYADGGISTDHESFTIEEALEKIKLGIKTQIREGSAARNFEALHELIIKEPLNTMLCTDDSHPDLIIEKGHIDRLIRLGLSKGYSIFDMYQTAVINPVQHYNLPVGLLREGDNADFIEVDSLDSFNVLATYIDGVKVAEGGNILFDLPKSDVINKFNCSPLVLNDLKVIAPDDNSKVKVMLADDGELLTDEYIWQTSSQKGVCLQSNINEDILKIVVVNRYSPTKPVIGFIKNFGLKQGALASSVAHDSHNIVAIGCDDESLLTAINGIIESKGGIIACNSEQKLLLKLPVAGLMSTQPGDEVASKYTALNTFVKQMGCNMKAPFMTLAFMSLLVIPSLKIGDKGLFDVNKFAFTSLFLDEK
ncbi:adenine deaminase [Carboxylicivirga sp. A043]|uniref:adenine deaminase n=1 Tax=Carboxylicivirga litoralis TaxID=2816963 RepID=UPI0021CB6271|nr:adenine deaminase [Carboxylicivirga sp. A043]MCU4156621.1 adenine deaminase [Carboxylicivirga sp. A043]